MQYKRLPNKTLKQFADITQILIPSLSDILSGGRGISKSRALQLEKASKKLGYSFTAYDWMFNPLEIRQQLLKETAA